ncbi:protein FAR-RED IMPAIRED RESPONSE 1-like [Capsicum annuum]|uniref:protein FAR-RED IMPAIRED RESPONSE 1-like n=1 Tax=Capsicum annuum TaxID=4072 RepID=UPI001FB09362|nr:protein FAR-RED IMPAIRED RESPONSE 1-like [Capsicum annuum]
MSFRCVQTAFTFYKEHSRLTGFGVVKKSAKKLVGQLKNVTFGCDKCQKTTTSNQSKRVDCKAKVNCQVMNDGLCIVTKVILENNHELEPAVFFSSQRELSRTVKRSLVVHDIVGLRPSKSIRLLEVEAQGSERMRCTLKNCCNYILQQRRLRILFSDTAVLHQFFVDMQSKDKFFFIQ